MQTKHLTIRGVSPDLQEALEAEKKRRGTSLNQVVLQLLRQSLGLGAESYGNGLRQFAGTWNQKDLAAFETNIEVFEQIDEALWK
jgi:hypothetical protein